MRSAVFVLLTLVLSGCRCSNGKIDPSTLELQVPKALTFEPAWVGYAQTAELSIVNKGRVAVELQATLTAEFTIAQPSVRVEAGTTQRLTLTFGATTPGDASGTLRLAGGDLAFDVALTATATAPPVCTDDACHFISFSPDAGACVSANKADGLACSNACVTAGSCQAGECKGAFETCDDHNKCTTDACGEAGCVHVPVACTNAGACKDSRCEPATGCVDTDAIDGTSCGLLTCTRAQVCVTGTCVLRTPPTSECVSFCSADGWCWQNPQPSGHWYARVAGTSNTNVWAVGLGGALHWDGQSWLPVNTGIKGGLTGLAVAGPNDVWVGGILGALSHWNGTTWTVSATGAPGWVNGLWGSANDVWGVGNGFIVHWDGATWTTVISDLALHLNSLWGSGPNDVWAVGETLSHWNGTAWASVPSGPAQNLVGIWGSSSSDVWAVGNLGMIHFDGTAWSPVSGVSEVLTGIWGSAANDITAVGQNGKALHWNGVGWASQPSGTTDDLNGVWGAAPTDLWAVGARGTILRSTGSGWKQMLGIAIKPDLLAAVGGSSSVDIWAVGSEGSALHWNGVRWSSVPTGTTARLVSVWAKSTQNAWAVGGDVILHWDGLRWTPTFLGAPSDLGRVWGRAANDVWAVGKLGARVLHWNGLVWTDVPVPAPASVVLGSVWGSASNDVWVVGHDGTQSVMFHWDGAAWSARTPPADLLRIIRGTSANDVWVTAGGSLQGPGPDPKAFHWNGTAWTGQSTAMVQAYDIWAAAPDDVWATSDLGAILHWDGVSWRLSDTGTYDSFWGVWGVPGTGVWIVGGNGAIMFH